MILFVAGGFINISKSSRKIACLCLTGIFLFCAVINQFPQKGDFEIVMLDCPSAAAVFIDDENRAVAVSEFSDYACVNEIKAVCAERGIKSFDVIVLEYDSFEPRYVLGGGSDGATVGTLYKMRGNDSEKDLILSRGGIKTADAFYGAEIGDKMSFFAVVANGAPAGVNVRFNGKNIFVSFNGSSEADMLTVARIYDGGADVVMTDSASKRLYSGFGCLLLTNQYTEDENFYSAKRLGNFTLRVLNDKIILLA